MILMASLLLFCSNLAVGQEDWVNRKDWPADFPRPPKTDKSLFYLQRNRNSNTIAYDLNIKSNGELDKSEPIDVYWKRYTGKRNGLRDELTWFQENFGFGYSVVSSKTDEFILKLVAYKDRKIKLKKINGKWLALMEINGKFCQLSNIYVYADESGTLPDVEHIDLYGKDLDTGKSVKERILT